MKANFLMVAVLTAVQVFLSSRIAYSQGLSPVELRCEYRADPRGIDEVHPRLSWRVESIERGQKQKAFRILVASRPELLSKNKGDLWDSGKIAGDDTVNIVYAGKSLGSRQDCFWKVCVWDVHSEPQWSRNAEFTMGLLNSDDWKSEYITFRDTTPVWKDTQSLYLPPARQYRKAFTVKEKSVKKATLYATALGIYELYLNGHRIGDAYFAPGWTDYKKRAYYYTYDVTPMIKSGANAVGAWVADGWYAGYIGFGLLTGIGTEKTGRDTYGKTPALMLQLEISYTDGSSEVVPTDTSWKVSGDGPVREADFLMGESYDARKEAHGWDMAGFDDSGWENAILPSQNGSALADFYEYSNGQKPGDTTVIKSRQVDLGFVRPAKLEAFPGVPVRPIEEIRPVSISSPSNGVYIFDLGQNFAGVVRLKLKGEAGSKIQLRYGEMLYSDGRLMNENYRKARSIDQYILRSDKNGEEWTPQFTYHGFRYVEISGLTEKPDKDAVTGIVLHSDTPLTSGFECSDPMANRLFKNIVWTQRANFMDLPTDCPQRDERFGWTGDAQIYANAATYNADVAAFYTKWLRDLMDSQRPSGVFPGYAPFPFQHGWDFGTAWCDAGVICPWTVWHAYGDTRIIDRCWPSMVRFLEWRQQTSKDFLGVVHGNEWGDWLSIGEKTPIDFIDTVYFAYSAELMADMAKATHRKTEADQYRRLFENIRKAFNTKYVHADGSLAVDTETAYALSIYMNLLDDGLRLKAGRILADKIERGETSDRSGMTTGFLGTRPLLLALTGTGQNSAAVKLFQSRKFPSWGYEVEQGATTIWEHWDSYTKAHEFGGEDGNQNASMNSFSHYSFGAVGEWMLGDLAGIRSDGPGYKKIIICPSLPAFGGAQEREPINWVKAHYDSIRGRIASNWRITGGRFELKIEVPANTTATVFMPAAGSGDIFENGQPLSKVKGAKFERMAGDRAVLIVQSGVYNFSSKFNH